MRAVQASQPLAIHPLECTFVHSDQMRLNTRVDVTRAPLFRKEILKCRADPATD